MVEGLPLDTGLLIMYVCASRILNERRAVPGLALYRTLVAYHHRCCPSSKRVRLHSHRTP